MYTFQSKVSKKYCFGIYSETRASIEKTNDIKS